jgi:dTMP kinase
VKRLFITLEGGEGAGKSTLIDGLYSFLSSRGLKVIKTRAPGATAIGQSIRQLLLHREEMHIVPRCELLLFLADRAQHVDEVIMPALDSQHIVLCDRFNDSTMAYQAKARGFPEELVKQLCTFASRSLVPDLTFYLDIDPKLGLERVQRSGSKDRIESEQLSFHQAIRNAFLEMAQQEPRRFRVLDATLTKDQVLNDALRFIHALL